VSALTFDRSFIQWSLGTKTCSYPFLDGELIFEARYTDAPGDGSGEGEGEGEGEDEG